MSGWIAWSASVGIDYSQEEACLRCSPKGTLLSEFERFYADPGYRTSAITFIASSGRRAA
jgi:hypothetical protein